MDLYNFSTTFKERSIDKEPPIPFHLIVRSIIASKDAKMIEVPLAFFRKGKIDVYFNRYIDAFYDFYFLLETCYGNGKTKNYLIKKEFCNSSELKEFINQVLKEKNFIDL